MICGLCPVICGLWSVACDLRPVVSGGFQGLLLVLERLRRSHSGRRSLTAVCKAARDSVCVILPSLGSSVRCYYRAAGDNCLSPGLPWSGRRRQSSGGGTTLRLTSGRRLSCVPAKSPAASSRRKQRGSTRPRPGSSPGAAAAPGTGEYMLVMLISSPRARRRSQMSCGCV